jgi:presenilin-like A22 family membrane protease
VVGVSNAESGPLARLDVEFPDPVPGVATYALALAAIGLGVLGAPALSAAGIELHHDPGSAHSLVPIVVGGAVGTLTILAVQWLDAGKLVVRAFLIGSWGLAAAVFSQAFAPGLAAPVVLGVAVVVVLWVHPEWYVVDAFGVAYCAGVMAYLGISVVPGLLVALLAGMAAYDAVSVYRTGHMQSLVSGGFDMDVPLAFVVPRRLSFSLRDAGSLDELSGSDDGAAILGFGDALFPGLLAVSAGHFLGPGAGETLAPTLVAGVSYLNAPAVGALAGGVVGMVALHALLKHADGAQPALVVLNPAIVGGYLVGAVAAGVPLAAAVGL